MRRLSNWWRSINTNAEKLKTLKATVDIDSSVLEEKKNRVKDNPQVAGVILVRKPEMLRMRIYVPVRAQRDGGHGQQWQEF